MTRQPFNVLFPRTGNSARGIRPESLLNHYWRRVEVIARMRPNAAQEQAS